MAGQYVYMGVNSIQYTLLRQRFGKGCEGGVRVRGREAGGPVGRSGELEDTKEAEGGT